LPEFDFLLDLDRFEDIKRVSEAVNGRRIDNTMIYKTLHRKLQI
jgi:hypothetical protein